MNSVNFLYYIWSPDLFKDERVMIAKYKIRALKGRQK